MSEQGGGAIEALITQLAATLEPAQRVSLEPGIYLTVDGAGRPRFQVRLRLAGCGSKRKTQTVDTLEQARELRASFRQSRRGGRSAARTHELGRLSFEECSREQWWLKYVLNHCGDVTQVSYG